MLILPNTEGSNNLVDTGAVINDSAKVIHGTNENPKNFFINDFPVSAIDFL